MTTEVNCPSCSFLHGQSPEDLSEEQLEKLALHFSQHESCRVRFEQSLDRLQLIPDDVKEVLRTAPTQDQALGKLIARLRERRPDEKQGWEDARKATDAEQRSDDFFFLSPSDNPEHLGRIGKYEIIELLGKGGMGMVFRGHDAQLNRFVAVKVPAPQLIADPTARRGFLREARAAAAVRHENVVTVHDVDEVDGVPFLVMEYIEGISLEQRIRQSGPLELKEILRIGMQAALGLDAAHAQGVVHRDIKPPNVLLENGVERVKITDFGVARIVDDVRVTQTGVVAGTPEYMSPEQIEGKDVDHRSDLFSLGSVMYAMCTGQAAFRGETPWDAMRRVCDDTPNPIRDFNSETPGWLIGVIKKLLDKRPTRRFQSASEVAELLRKHLAGLQQPYVAGQLRVRLWKWAAAALMVVSLALVLTLMAFSVIPLPWTDSTADEVASRRNTSGPETTTSTDKPEAPVRLEEQPSQISWPAPSGFDDWKVSQTFTDPNVQIDLDALEQQLGERASRLPTSVTWNRDPGSYALNMPTQKRVFHVLPDELRIAFRVDGHGRFRAWVCGEDSDVLAVLAPSFGGTDKSGKCVVPGAVGFLEPSPRMTMLFTMLSTEFARLEDMPGVVSEISPYWKQDLITASGRIDSTIVTTFDQPVWIVYTAIIRWEVDSGAAPANDYLDRVFKKWYPRGEPYPGETSRSVSISYQNPTAGWIHALAQMDNGNHGEIRVDESLTLVQQSNWGTSYGSRQGMFPNSVSISGSTRWSAYGLDFGMAVLADDVTFANCRESPGTGPVKNPPPLAYRIPPRMGSQAPQDKRRRAARG